MVFADSNDRTIDSSWNFLLLEAARRLDEQEFNPATKSGQLRVLVVDDSRLFTKAFIKLFEEKVDATVVGTATNGKEALKFLEMQVPDLVTLDVNMPVMGGDVALKHIMILSPAPVVLVSNFNEQACSKLMDFMRLGAVDVVAKPINPQSWEIVSKRLKYILTNVEEFQLHNVSRAKNLKPVTGEKGSGKAAEKLLLFIGGLGGMLELQKIIPFLKYGEDTAIVVLQNMYPSIADHLATYLDAFTPYLTTPLNLGEELLGGQCRVGNCHGKREIIIRDDTPFLVGINDETNEMSIDSDQLLLSAADIFGSDLTTVMLSGVDMDLKNGLEYVVDKGGKIILQNPESCLMPGPIEGLQSLAGEDVCMKPEEIAAYLSSQI